LRLHRFARLARSGRTARPGGPHVTCHGPHAAASLEPALPIGVGVVVEDQPRLPLSLIPVADLLTLAARARRFAATIDGDSGASRLIEMAEDLEAEVARLSRLE
jgi:hypothetical protein